MTKKDYENENIKGDEPQTDNAPAASPSNGAAVQRNSNKKFITAVVVVLIVIILAAVTAILVKQFVYTSYIVEGISMYPTLDGGNGAFMDNNDKNGEKLILNKVAKINRNDIVVFKPGWPGTNDKALVKRVVAVAGDKISVIDDTVYLNGKVLNETYINEPMFNSPGFSEFTVPADCIVCMGDNRNNSNDCRYNYPHYVSLEKVIGKCVLIKGINGKLRQV